MIRRRRRLRALAWLLPLAMLAVAAPAAAQVFPGMSSGAGAGVQGAGAGAATNFWNFRLTDGTGFYQALTDTQLRSTPINVVCTSGCTAGGSFADAAAFTFATTAVGILAAVVDDTATNTVAEDSAGAPRMSSNRVLYLDLSKTTANATAVKVDGSAVTQPVSGTFFQATQPVSAAALPLPAGAATAALQTQPGVDIGDVTVNNAAGAAAVNIQDGGNSLTVDGTVTVTDGSGALNVIVDSGSVTANAGTNLNTSALGLEATQVDNRTALQIMDDWDETDRAKVNPIAGQAGVQGASGVVTALTQRVVLATDVALPAGTNAIGKLSANSGVDIGDVDVTSLPSVTIGTFPDNEPFNLAQVAGATVATGNGTAAGSVRVALPTDGTGVVGLIAGSATVGSIASVTTSVVPGTAATNLGKAEDAAHTTADTGVAVWGVRTDPTTTAYTTATTEYSPVGVDYVGAVYEGVHPGRFSCFVPLTATVTTQCQAAPAAGLRAYVTSLVCSNGAATVQGVDIVFGTGAACVTGITALTHKFQMGTNALTTSPFQTSAFWGENAPLVPTAANAICTRPTAATAYGCTITGFIAP